MWLLFHLSVSDLAICEQARQNPEARRPKSFPAQVRGTAVATSYSIGRVGSTLSPLLIGLAASRYSIGLGIGLLGISYAVCALVPRSASHPVMTLPAAVMGVRASYVPACASHIDSQILHEVAGQPRIRAVIAELQCNGRNCPQQEGAAQRRIVPHRSGRADTGGCALLRCGPIGRIGHPAKKHQRNYARKDRAAKGSSPTKVRY